MIAEDNTAGRSAPASASGSSTIEIAEELRPHLRKAAAYIADTAARTLCEHLAQDDVTATHARRTLERALAALADLDDGPLRVSTIALLAAEAVNDATMELDDNVAMHEYVQTVDGLDHVAGKVARARALRALADQYQRDDADTEVAR